jgi:predicted DCC family thiol-disulfide oxidoreductase YuxK
LVPKVVRPNQHRLNSSWIKNFQLDDHSLALFRIGLGLASLINVIVRATTAEFLPSIDGIDLSGAINHQQNGVWSLHWLVGDSLGTQLALLALMAICSLTLAIGFRTPLSKIILLLLTISLHNSNPLVINMGDRLLATALFWACLLPVGHVWSVDRLLRPAAIDSASPPPVQDQNSRWAELGYVAQIVLLYWMAASHKSLQGWLVDGSAVWMAFHIDIFAWPAARQLLAFPALLQLFSRGAYMIQWGAPLLLIWPSRSMLPRLLGLSLLLSMHLGFLPFLKLGLFPWVSIICLLPLIPSQLWDRCSKPRIEHPLLPTIFYDQDCRFCRDAATIVTRLLRIEACPLIPAQHHAEVEQLMRQANSWVVQTSDGQQSLEFAAFLQLCNASPWAHGLTAPLQWSAPLGSRLYRLISNHRRSAWRLLNALRTRPIPIGKRLRQASAATAILLMLVAAWHTNMAQASSAFRQATAPFGNRLKHLGLQQRWIVFSPMPLQDDGWLEIYVKDNNTTKQRLLVPTLTPLNSSQNPFLTTSVYRTQRHRKFFTNLQRPSRHELAVEAYLRYVCRQLPPATAARTLELVWMQETTQPPPLPPAPVVAIPRQSLSCNAS